MPKFRGCSKRYTKTEVYSDISKKKIPNDNVTLPLKELERKKKERILMLVSRRI